MEYLSSSSSNSMILLGPLYSQNNDKQIIFEAPPYDHAPCSTQLQSQADPTLHIMPPEHHHDDDDDQLDHLLNLQIPPSFLDVHQTNNDHGGGDDNHCSNKQARKKQTGEDDGDGDGDGDNDASKQDEKKKRQKVQHREIERQRRLEMSSLHATLRSLLPLEYIKGKRSMSEHFNETVKYIKHLQQRIQSLSNQRDAFKSQTSNYNKSDGYDDVNSNGDFEVKVHPSNNNGGILEVIISTTNSQVLPLSRVLQCLIKLGFEVITCISTNNNNTLVHSIQAQVEDEKSIGIDAVKLKQILAETP